MRIFISTRVLTRVFGTVMTFKWRGERERRAALESEVRELRFLRRRECTSLLDRLLPVELEGAPRESLVVRRFRIIKFAYLAIDCAFEESGLSDEEMERRLREATPLLTRALVQRRDFRSANEPTEPRNP